MTQARISNKAVNLAFAAFIAGLKASGFSHSWTLYYRHGEFIQGPAITITADSIELVVEKIEGKNSWSFKVQGIPDSVLLHGEQWRPATFGLSDFPNAFQGNRAAYEWFTQTAAHIETSI